MTESLRFRQIRFALAPGHFRQRPLDGNAREMSNVSDRFLLTQSRRAWLAIVHGKRSDHFAFGGKDRRRPTRAERMSQGQFAKSGPEWIGRNIGDNYLFGAISGCPA